jgi:hypothetical protein
MTKVKPFNLKSISSLIVVSVLSQYAYSWIFDKTASKDVLFDILEIDYQNNLLEIDVIIKNYSGNVTKFRGIELQAFIDNKMVASGPVNSDLFILKNDQTFILDKIALKAISSIENEKELNFKLLATLDGRRTELKAFQSNKFGAVYNESHAKALQQATL